MTERDRGRRKEIGREENELEKEAGKKYEPWKDKCDGDRKENKDVRIDSQEKQVEHCDWNWKEFWG